MSDSIQDAQVVEPQAEAAAAPAPGPAHEIRQAQALLAGGLFPGQMAPAIVSAFQTLGKIADKIEADAKAASEAVPLADEPTFTEQVKAQIADANKE